MIFVIVVGIILPGTFIISGPWIVSKTSLRQKIVPWAAPELKGECSIGGCFIRLVFTRYELDDVSLEDSESKPLLTDARQSISIGRFFELLVAEALAGRHSRFLMLRFILVADENSTNWERALETLLAQPSVKSPCPCDHCKT